MSDDVWNNLDDFKDLCDAAGPEVRGYRTAEVFDRIPQLVAELEYLRNVVKTQDEAAAIQRARIDEMQEVQQTREWGYALANENRLMIRFPHEAAARTDQIKYSPKAKLAYQDVTYGPLVFPDKETAKQ